MVVLLLPLLRHRPYLCFWEKGVCLINKRKTKQCSIIKNVQPLTCLTTRTHGEPFRPLIVVKFAAGSRLIQHMHDGRGL